MVRLHISWVGDSSLEGLCSTLWQLTNLKGKLNFVIFPHQGKNWYTHKNNVVFFFVKSWSNFLWQFGRDTPHQHKESLDPIVEKSLTSFPLVGGELQPKAPCCVFCPNWVLSWWVSTPKTPPYMWKEKRAGVKEYTCKSERTERKGRERLNFSMSSWFKECSVPCRKIMFQTEMFCLGHNSRFGC